MTEEIQEAPVLYYVYVDRVGERPYRQDIAVMQRDASVDAKGLKVAATSDILSPDKSGVFRLETRHQNHEMRVAVIKAKMERENRPGQAKVLAGPFTRVEDALKAKYDERPKTAHEEAAIERAKRIELEKVNASLAERIALFEEAKKPGKKEKPGAE